MHESVLFNFIGQMLQFVQVTCITISSSLEFRFDYLLSRTVLIIVCVFLLLLYMLMPSSLAKIFWSTPLPTCEERCGSELILDLGRWLIPLRHCLQRNISNENRMKSKFIFLTLFSAQYCHLKGFFKVQT